MISTTFFDIWELSNHFLRVLPHMSLVKTPHNGMGIFQKLPIFIRCDS
jgi:hypothetical protein